MKRHIFTWISGGLLSLILIIFACTDEDQKTVVAQPTSKRTPAMVEIENFLKGQELCIPDISKSFPQTAATRSSMPTIQRPAEKLEPIWHTLKTCKGDQDNIRTVLLQADNPILGYIHEKNGGKSKQRMHNASFKLAVIKNKGTLVGRIITFIPDAKYKQDFTNNIIELGFNVNNTNYSGLQLVSTLDGVFLYGDRYDEGKPVYHFMPTATYKRHCLEHEHGHEHDSLPAPISPDKAHLFLRLHTFKTFANTRTDGYGFEETGDGETCSFCGKNVDECTCVTITAPIIVRCPVCGMDIKYCLCCQRCHQYPCTCCTTCWHYPCVCCPQCHRYPCTCLISGGGGGGGGTKPPQTHQMTQAKLSKAAKDAVDRVLREHNNDTIAAYCNEGVRNAFETLFNSKALYGMKANTMTKYWTDHPNEWQPIQMKDAQDLANKGYFVVAGWINPQANKSGHVVVIVPGTASYGGWNGTRTLVPNVMDTGSNMRNASQQISKSFGRNKHSTVVFFKYK